MLHVEKLIRLHEVVVQGQRYIRGRMMMAEEGRAGPSSHGSQGGNAELLLGSDPQHARPRPYRRDCFDWSACLLLCHMRTPALTYTHGARAAQNSLHCLVDISMTFSGPTCRCAGFAAS